MSHKSLISVSLKKNKPNEIVCILVIIALAVVIPRYVKLPMNVELLFNDRIGQLLLLLLAVMIGSYNFVCGVLLVVLFLSIMIKVSKSNSVEGFENENEEEDEDDDDTKSEEIIEKSESFASKKTKTTPKPSPTPTKSKPTKGKPTPAPTKGKPTPTPKVTFEEESEEPEEQEPEKTEDEMEIEMENKKTMSESAPEEPEEETVEGFNCGCDTNDRRAKLINYARADQVDPSLSGLFETFENPPQQSNTIITPNPFDVAGCRYDLKEGNPLHETVYGAPVDSCMAYQSANVSGTGTVFYPLNAF